MYFILSERDVFHQFAGAKNLATSTREDFDDGPIAFNDNSRGLSYQVWGVRIENDDCIVFAENTPEYVLFTHIGLDSVSLTFDGSAYPVVSYVADENAYLRFYDSLSQNFETINLGEQLSPKVFNDEKRNQFSSDADVHLVYIRGNSVYNRLQRERFTIEREIASNVTSREIIRFGMQRNYRLGIKLKQTEEPTRLLI